MFSPLPKDVSARVRELGPERVERIHLPDHGLLAYVVLDSTVLGPAAGGVRTKAYETELAVAEDACRLARAMTYKCALGGLDAGGGKVVVRASPALKRPAAFAALGRAIDALDGDLRTAGDYGTTDADLAAMASRYVHTDTAHLTGAVARGVVRCAEAIADVKGRPGLSGLTAAVQGVGDIGAAVARALVEAGARVRVADVDAERAERVAEEIGAEVVAPEDVLYEDVDLLSPCAIGDVIGPDVGARLRAWAIVGGANNITTGRDVDVLLHRRGVTFVPDLLSSAGAVIEGIGRTVMGMGKEERLDLVDTLRHTARLVLEDAERTGEPPIVHALRRAEARIANAR